MPTALMHRYRRYVYDLQDVVEGLRAAAHYRLAQAEIEAWILNELRLAYKVQDLEPYETSRQAQGVHNHLEGDKLRHVFLRQLLVLFDPMSHEYYDADFADVQFRHAVLTISLYSFTEVPSGRFVTSPTRPRPPRDEETPHHAQRFHGLRRHC